MKNVLQRIGKVLLWIAAAAVGLVVLFSWVEGPSKPINWHLAAAAAVGAYLAYRLEKLEQQIADLRRKLYQLGERQKPDFDVYP